MRVAACLLVALTLLASCGDDDDGKKPSSSSTTTTEAVCSPAPTLPNAADGSPAQMIANAGNVQIAIVDHGASVDVVSLFVPVNCELEALTIDGSAAALPIGGTVNHGDGLACSGTELEVRTATSDDGATYQVTATTYRIEGTELVEVGTLGSTIEAQEDPDRLSGFYRLDC